MSEADNYQTDVCAHGALKRSCYICELEAELAEWKKRAEEWERTAESNRISWGLWMKRAERAEATSMARKSVLEGMQEDIEEMHETIRNLQTHLERRPCIADRARAVRDEIGGE